MLTLAPLYFEGEIAFGVITQGSSAFRTILAALSFVVSRFDSLGGLMAETARITALESQLTAEGTAAARHERDALRQQNKELRAAISGTLEALPTPATHAILTQLKAGETVYQVDKLPQTL